VQAIQTYEKNDLKGGSKMNNLWSESLVEKTVTYSLAIGDQFYLIENVPVLTKKRANNSFHLPLLNTFNP
jgi:hypothetical protein